VLATNEVKEVAVLIDVLIVVDVDVVEVDVDEVVDAKTYTPREPNDVNELPGLL